MTRSKGVPALILGAMTILAAPLAASDVVVQSDQTRTYDCAGGAATVEGGYNVITLRNCATVVVKGGDNTVDAGLADSIEILGADNKLTWTERADGRRPRIADEGSDNTIRSRRAPAGSPAAAGAPTTPATRPAATPAPVRPSSGGRVIVSSEGVKVQGTEGTVTVGADGTVAIAESSGALRVAQNGGKADHDCRGASAVVSGDRNELTFRNCDRITISGTANKISVRSVASVLLNGADNTLAWEPAPDGSRPKITDNGRGNTVSGKR